MSEVQQLKSQLEYSKHLITLRDKVLELRKNENFKYLIEEVFMEKECAAYARESANHDLTPEERESSLAMAQAAGYLDKFLNKYLILGQQAENTIPHIEQAILEEAQAGNDE